MAEVLSLSGPVGYMGGAEQINSGPFVGWSAGKNYVLRYYFKTPSNGYVTQIKLTQKFTKYSGSTYAIGSSYPVRVKITTSDSEYKNAGSDFSYDATFTGSGTVTISGLKLSPDTTYYLWLFPGFSSAYSLSYCYDTTGADQASATCELSPLGRVYIGNGGSAKAYGMWIGRNGKLVRLVPYVYKNSKMTRCS